MKALFVPIIKNFIFLIFSFLLLCLETTIIATFPDRPLPIEADDNGVINKCLDKERQALLHFKARLQDRSDQLSTWSVDDDACCKWGGVVCNNQTGHVTELHLSITYPLGGQISPSLLNLTYLHHLDLSKNSFHGTIPNFIGSIARLTHLDLHSNDFNGTIPKSIGSLTQLRRLDLSHNSFNGTIPPEFGNLTNLRYLSLGTFERSCMIENLDWLSNLSHLQNLEMDGISLAKANHWVNVILSLPNLFVLSLRRCDLSRVVHPYSNCSSSSPIGDLSLGYNNLNSSMYGWLFPLTTNRLITYLDLSGNMLDGIPKYLRNLCNLKDLDLFDNSEVIHFLDFLNNLCGLTLRNLDASYGRFIGSIPNEIQKFSSLEFLDLSHNHLNGTMSEKVWELTDLQTLDVSSNSLVITPNTRNSKLFYIDLSGNTLEVIPSTSRMLNVSYVTDLYLSACKVGPLFPKWIQTHKYLTHLDISGNQISDTIPIQFWKTWPSQLRYLNLSSNNISGKVPDLTSNFDLVSTIDLSSNNFFGPIPNIPPTLLSLNLSKNKFYGGISFLCQIVDGLLSFLDLSHNSLTGQLPECLWHSKELKVLNLGHNNLCGRLPASIGYLVQLQVLHLYNNSFSGELPLAMKNCIRLTFLNLGANKFFGNVTVWVGENLKLLYAISLRSNNFFGPIPLQVCHLMNLQILDLSINNLNGTIPSCVSNLKAMVDRRFFLGRNIHSPLIYNPNVDITLGNGRFIYVDNAMIEWQGNEREFTSNLGLLTSIDLSSNNLTGKIPNELVHLHELFALNLSKNGLHREIPRKISEMKQLLTLDLSRNHFSGWIPSSMSQMASLNYLDMSYNKFSGRIPSSTQLQSFEPWKYIGNAGLCGPPLTKSFPGDEVPPVVATKSDSVEEATDEVERWFYIGGSIGFAIGFWIACGALLVNRRGRHAFFPFVDFLKDWVYVKVMVFIRKLQRVQYA